MQRVWHGDGLFRFAIISSLIKTSCTEVKIRNKLFYFTYIIANLSLIIYGLMAALQPDLLLEPFSKNVYQFPPDAVDAVAYVGALIRLMGFFNLLLGIFGLILFWRWRLSNEPWILRSVIGLSFFSYLGPVIFDNTVGTIGFFEILEHVIFFAIIVLGVLMLADKEDAIENE